LNVFSYHPDTETVGFQSKPMQLYVAQKVEEQKRIEDEGLFIFLGFFLIAIKINSSI